MQFVSAYIETQSAEKRNRIDIFTDGVFNSNILLEGFDLSDYKENLGGTTASEISSLSQWYLTRYPLMIGQQNAEPFYIDSNEKCLRKAGEKGSGSTSYGRIGYTAVDFYIPIKRIQGYSKLYFTSKIVKFNGYNSGVDYNTGSLAVSYVRNGNMSGGARIPVNGYPTDWTIKEVDISNIPYIDYIMLYGCDGASGFKDIYVEA